MFLVFKWWFLKYYFLLKEERVLLKIVGFGLGLEKYNMSLEDVVIVESKEVFKGY